MPCRNFFLSPAYRMRDFLVLFLAIIMHCTALRCTALHGMVTRGHIYLTYTWIHISKGVSFIVYCFFFFSYFIFCTNLVFSSEIVCLMRRNMRILEILGYCMMHDALFGIASICMATMEFDIFLMTWLDWDFEWDWAFI